MVHEPGVKTDDVGEGKEKNAEDRLAKRLKGTPFSKQKKGGNKLTARRNIERSKGNLPGKWNTKKDEKKTSKRPNRGKPPVNSRQ